MKLTAHSTFTLCLLGLALGGAGASWAKGTGGQQGNEAAGVRPTVIALIRHGEKPEEGHGMINCQGLNRALALPPVLARIAGRPDAALAPNPGSSKKDRGVIYSYNRPLLTLAPSAIAAGIPVDASIAWNDAKGLAALLVSARFEGKVVYVAWEHHLAMVAARELFALLGSDPSDLPASWADDDFDSVYLITLTGHGTNRQARVERVAQNLKNLSTSCPVPN